MNEVLGKSKTYTCSAMSSPKCETFMYQSCTRRSLNLLQIMNKNSDAPSALEPCDDLAGISNTVEPDWRVVKKLELGCCDANHIMTACSPAAFTPGDFINIAVTCNIIIRCTDTGSRTIHVHLNLEHVLQVAPTQLNEVCVTILHVPRPRLHFVHTHALQT